MKRGMTEERKRRTAGKIKLDEGGSRGRRSKSRRKR